MSFFHKKMSQNLWATIMPFGPVTNILLAPKKIRVSQRLTLISGTVVDICIHFRRIVQILNLNFGALLTIWIKVHL